MLDLQPPFPLQSTLHFLLINKGHDFASLLPGQWELSNVQTQLGLSTVRFCPLPSGGLP